MGATLDPKLKWQTIETQHFIIHYYKGEELVAGRIAEIAREEFEVATGYRAEAVHVSRTRIPAWDETWDGLEGVKWPRDLHICSNYTARPGILGRITEAKRLAATLVTEHSPGS